MGPETYNDLGNETYLSANRLPKGTGIEHLRDSNITDTGTVVSINSNTQVTGSFTVTTGSAVELQVTNLGVNIGSALIDSHIISGSLRVNPNGLFVSGSGVVGIGTTSPLGLLHITPESVTGTRVDGLRLSKPITDAANYLAFQQGANGWRMGINYNDGTYPLVFLYGSSTPTAASPGSEFMRITSDGNVLVGATAGRGGGSTGHLFKMPSGDAYFEIMANSTTGQSDVLFSDGTSGAYGLVGYDHSNDSMRFYVNSSERITITSGGNVGIGTTSPLTSLTVKSTNDNGYALTRPSNAATYHWNLTTTETGTDAYTVRYDTFNNNAVFATHLGGGTGGNIIFRAGGTYQSEPERMRITSGGNIDISGGSVRTNGGTFRLADSGGTTVGGYFLRKASWLGTGTDHTPSIAAEGGYGINFYTNGQTAERMIITSGGNVLINTTSDNSTRLNVNGTTFTQILTQSVPLHGVKVLSYGPVSSATIDLPTEFPLMLLTAGNVWGVFGKYCGFDAGGVEVREFVICRNSGGSWASANYGPQSQTNASLQSVTGSGTTITVNVDSGSYFIVELTVFVR
jgi:hypothetical protein